MRFKTSLLLAIFTCLDLYSLEQVSIDEFIIQEESPVNQEAMVSFYITNLSIKGYSQKLISLVLAVSDREGKKIVTDYHQMETGKGIFNIGKLEFKITYQDLLKQYGKGRHHLYVVFDIHTMINEELIMLPGARRLLEWDVDLNLSEVIDPYIEVEQLNTRIIKEKSLQNPVFSQLSKLASEYGLIIILRDFSLGSSAFREHYSWDDLSDIDDKQLVKYIEALDRYWRVLPVEFVKKTKLKGLVLVKNLSFLGLDIGAGFDVADRLLICEVNNFFTHETIMNAFFHEYMHLMDNIFYNDDYFNNRAWNDLNPPGDWYTSQGALAMIRNNSDFVSKEHPMPGFINGYCSADIYQDKAEVFAHLLIPVYYIKAFGWNDSIINAKFASIYQSLKKIYPPLKIEHYIDSSY